jgi:hypothetical protein
LPFFLERLATETINKEKIVSNTDNVDGLSGKKIYNHVKFEVSQ